MKTNWIITKGNDNSILNRCQMTDDTCYVLLILYTSNSYE